MNAGDFGSMVARPVVRVGVMTVIAVSGAAFAHAANSPGRSAAERECLARAMYFESNKSAEDGMLAVGTVVANRVRSGRYGGTMCSVVGQRGQFAAGVMSRSMTGEAAERARKVADAVLSGKRHPAVREAMFFHTAGLRFRYDNMHYTTVAGGNIFYEKRGVADAASARANATSMARAYAKAKTDQAAAAPVLASLNAPAVQQPAATPERSFFAFFRPVQPAPAPAPATVQVASAAITPAPAAVVAPVPTPRPPAATTVVASIGPAKSVSAPLPPQRPRDVASQGYDLASASAYANPTPSARSAGALGAVAALEPKHGPRVISMVPPVQAAAIPTPASRPALVESMPSPRANMVVALAWAEFQ